MIVFWCSIGAVYFAQGNHDNALTAWKEALQIQVKALGPEHLEVAKTQDSIAIVYHKMGELDKALQMSRNSLKIFEKVLGPELPDVAKTKVSRSMRACAVTAY